MKKSTILNFTFKHKEKNITMFTTTKTPSQNAAIQTSYTIVRQRNTGRGALNTGHVKIYGKLK